MNKDLTIRESICSCMLFIKTTWSIEYVVRGILHSKKNETLIRRKYRYSNEKSPGVAGTWKNEKENVSHPWIRTLPCEPNFQTVQLALWLSRHQRGSVRRRWCFVSCACLTQHTSETGRLHPAWLTSSQAIMLPSVAATLRPNAFVQQGHKVAKSNDRLEMIRTRLIALAKS